MERQEMSSILNIERDIFNVHSIRRQLEVFNSKYNAYRPHQSLGNLTPMEYFKKHYQKVKGAA